MRIPNFTIPNCVPEYNRSMWEDEAHEFEKEMELLEWYKKNKEYQERKYEEGCWLIDFYPDECAKCKHGEEGSPCSKDDDIPTMICDAWRECPVFKEYVKRCWSDLSFEEVCSWHK